ncbi:MAG: DNA-directed RNA polymerase subunit B'' [Candidatus Pacearchaeota archaeon]
MVNKEKKELIDKEHVLVKTFFRDFSIVESNLASFNDFIENKLQKIAEELNEKVSDEEIEIKIEKINVEKPCITEADGSIKKITPYEARLRELTYSSPIEADITVKFSGQTETTKVSLGRIPVLVKSKVCNLYGLTKEELISKYEDPNDKGGYFIINGHEKVIMMSEDLASNNPFIEKNKQTGNIMLRMFSQRGSYKIPLTISENKEGILEISFSRFKKIPLIIVLKSLGLISEQEIFNLVGKENDSFVVNLNEYSNIGDQEEAMMKLAEFLSVQGTKREILERIKQRLDSYLLPHIGLTKKEREGKIKTLCKLVKKYYIAKENPSKNLTDKDHYSNKRIRLAGDLMGDLIRVNLNIFLREIRTSLQKTMKRRNFYSIKTIAKSTLFSSRVESAIATGSWIGEKTGVTQNMKKDNGFAMLSQLQKVISALDSEQENFAARTVHPTHYGRFCPIETPEGTEIGLRKNLSIFSRISTETNFPEEKMIKILKEEGMVEKEKDDVFFNGKFIGCVSSCKDFFYKLREKRRRGEIPMETSFKIDEDLNSLFIYTEIGRVLRPLIVVEKGKPRLNENHLKLLKEGIIKWENLIKEGIIEYIDASEEDNSLIALYPEELTEEHDYLEISPISCLGIITSLVPYANHDQSARLLRGSKTITQSLGIYASNFPVRLDTNVSILTYPQKPLARSFIYDFIGVYPAGQNVVVAVLPYEAYNVDDAIVLNKGSVNRGFGRSTYYKPYFSAELNYAGRLKDKFCIPDKDISGYRTEDDYKYLEEDGLIYPEAEVKEGDVLIGKVSPPKFLSDLKDLSIKTKKENSVAVKQEEEGIVDSVFLTQDEEGNKIAAIRLRDPRIPEIGDKFATPHGQKGIVGLIVDEENIPFTSKGIKPDIIFNPHGIPSRMTAGYLLEVLASKVASLSGKIIDATPFCGTELGTLEENLRKLGFREDGKETMYNAVTGEKMEVKIFVGTMYYLKLGRMVKNLLHARSTGKIALLTRQPIEGRAKGGGLRLGEMEQQALVGHGASLLLKERYSSDRTIINVCTKCGSLGIEDEIRKKKYCPSCGSIQIEPVDISYAFKLLIDELQSMHIKTKFELKNKYER